MEGNLYQRIYDLLAQVPAGHVVSYGEMARALGMPRGARVVGWAMRSCPEGYPWHRVVTAGGEITKRGSGEGEELTGAQAGPGRDVHGGGEPLGHPVGDHVELARVRRRAFGIGLRRGDTDQRRLLRLGR